MNHRTSQAFPPPPLSIVPLSPAGVTESEVEGWRVRAIFDSGVGGAAQGHAYLVDVNLAAIANGEVWEALASATLAGLCTRCSSVQDAEILLTAHVLSAVLAAASEFSWTHAPVIDEPCQLCQQRENQE